MEIAKGLVIAGTGHRLDKLGGYSDKVQLRLAQLACAVFKLYEPRLVITGMAIGWDMALALACGELNIPFVAAVPFKGQEARWPEKTVDLYNRLLGKASEVVYVCEPGYEAWKMQERNEYMVDRADLILALWNGSSGGTANCIQYAQKVHKPVLNVWRSWEKFK